MKLQYAYLVSFNSKMYFPEIAFRIMMLEKNDTEQTFT